MTRVESVRGRDGPAASEHVEAPLEGIRVLDLGVMLAGPLVGRVLGDLGAEVIKVERPGGELSRPTARAGDEHYWQSLHRGKRSVVLDLKESSGRNTLRSLLPNSDVLVENFRPGVMERCGLGWEDVHKLNPSLIYCSVSGYGSGGPLAQMPATDGAIQAFSGWTDSSLRLSGDLGTTPTNTISDFGSGLLAAQAVTAALFRRQRTGTGIHIDLSMAECSLYLRSLGHHPALLPPATFVATTSDDRRLLVQAAGSLAGRLTNMIQSEVASDPPIVAGDRAIRGSEGPSDGTLDLLARLISVHTLSECLRMCELAGVPAAEINSLDEALRHPQIAQRDAALSIMFSDGISRLLPGSPFYFNNSRLVVTKAAPDLGVDTELVMGLRTVSNSDSILDDEPCSGES